MTIIETLRQRIHSNLAGYSTSVIILAVVNYLAALLGNMLSIPPENITPFWPPAGVGVVALLFFGKRLCPGVWLASFAFNGLYHYQASIASHDHSMVWFYLSLAIASGSTLQTLVASAVSQKILSASDGWVARAMSLKKLTIAMHCRACYLHHRSNMWCRCFPVVEQNSFLRLYQHVDDLVIWRLHGGSPHCLNPDLLHP